VSGLCSFSLFSSFGFEHHNHINYFYGILKPSGFFGFFHAPSFVWAPLIIEDYSAYLDYFFFILALASSGGCDLGQGYFLKKNLLGSIGTTKYIFSLVKGLLKMVFSHFKCMH
jgi:hypothetical protein